MAPSVSITGSWLSLPQAAFEAIHPRGGFLHFRENTAQQTSVRNHISSLATTFGWPLRGFFISGSGDIPHYALHVSEFPVQTGSPSQRAEKLQNALDALFSASYEDQDILGTGVTQDYATYLIARCHVWNYINDLTQMQPRSAVGVGDFSMVIGVAQGSWWVNS